MNPASGTSNRAETVQLTVGGAKLTGTLTIPGGARGVVLFAHGSGSSRHSPRNRYVADTLHAAGFATLLLDLLTESEERQDLESRQFRFDIELLAERLVGAIDWLSEHDETGPLAVGLFGASTGAAAAIVAAAVRAMHVSAVVSRGGRPDLADQELPDVMAPTLFIVGERDPEVLDLNERAYDHMLAPARLEIVPRAGHLFEEPGALERVAALAVEWFEEHLGSE